MERRYPKDSYHILTNETLRHLARELRSDYMMLGLQLGLDVTDIGRIHQKCRDSGEDIAFTVLSTWRNETKPQSEHMQVSMLRAVLVDRNRKDLLTLLRDKRVALERFCSCVSYVGLLFVLLVPFYISFTVVSATLVAMTESLHAASVVVQEGLYDAWYATRGFMLMIMSLLGIVGVLYLILWFVLAWYLRRCDFRRHRPYAIRYN